MRLDTRATYGNFSNPSGPDDSKVWIVGDVQTITFNIDFREFSLTIQQEGPNGQGPIADYVIFRMPTFPSPFSILLISSRKWQVGN